MRASLILSFFLFLLSSYCSAGPATSCPSGSTDVCCNIAGFYSQADAYWLSVQTHFAQCSTSAGYCVICGEHDAQDTATAATTQNRITDFAQRFTTNQCWNGYVATSPATNVQFLNFKDYNCNVKNSACNTTAYYIPFDYTCGVNAAYNNQVSLWILAFIITITGFSF